MKLEDKLQYLRKMNGYSQEELADKLGIARQTISTWETGQATPTLQALIALSELYGVSIDRMVKEEDACNIQLHEYPDTHIHQVIDFLIRAKQHTYASGDHAVKPCRMNSHDYSYEEDAYTYYDTFLGSEYFSGEEAVWFHNQPLWCMNYSGRVIGDNFSSNFLKEVLSNVTQDFPYRGPKIYTKGDYHYHCKIDGAFDWFQGYEEIFYKSDKIYECYIHGGSVR